MRVRRRAPLQQSKLAAGRATNGHPYGDEAVRAEKRGSPKEKMQPPYGDCVKKSFFVAVVAGGALVRVVACVGVDHADARKGGDIEQDAQDQRGDGLAQVDQ